MKDAAGQDVNIGDVIAFTTTGSTTISFGLVEKITPKGVRASVLEPHWRTKRLGTSVKQQACFIVVTNRDTPNVAQFLKDIVRASLDKDLDSGNN